MPPEIIVGIIGVETRWGRVMGKPGSSTPGDAVVYYPRRAEYFSSELETFLLMARSKSDDPLDLKGSFAGAMGYGQFMPSSYKQYAVDFNGDGHINLWGPGGCYRQRGQLLQTAWLGERRSGGGAGAGGRPWAGEWFQD